MQLEMEIFRQLQMRRRDDRPSDSSDMYAASGGGSSAASSSSSANPNSLTSSNVASMSSPSSLPSSRTSANSHLVAASVNATKSVSANAGQRPLLTVGPGSNTTERSCRSPAACDETAVPVGSQEVGPVQHIDGVRYRLNTKPPKVPSSGKRNTYMSPFMIIILANSREPQFLYAGIVVLRGLVGQVTVLAAEMFLPCRHLCYADFNLFVHVANLRTRDPNFEFNSRLCLIALCVCFKK